MGNDTVLNVRLPAEQNQALAERAEKEGTTKSNLVRSILAWALSSDNTLEFSLLAALETLNRLYGRYQDENLITEQH